MEGRRRVERGATGAADREVRGALHAWSRQEPLLDSISPARSTSWASWRRSLSEGERRTLSQPVGRNGSLIPIPRVHWCRVKTYGCRRAETARGASQSRQRQRQPAVADSLHEKVPSPRWLIRFTGRCCVMPNADKPVEDLPRAVGGIAAAGRNPCFRMERAVMKSHDQGASSSSSMAAPSMPHAETR
jgi:hypothetical protein